MELQELYEIFKRHAVVTTDTRHCPEGSIFFALKGATFDGNQFAAQALAAGCAYAVVDDAEVAAADTRCLWVEDVLTTLQQLAHHHRRQLGTPIVQITGTNGKTTTKELAAAVLAEKYNVLYTQGNLNNHIGVPLTLLRLTAAHDIAVVETGANHPGEIAMLSDIVYPDCGLITNVGKAHLEGFGSFEGVVRTKTELYAHIRRRREAAGAEQPFVLLDLDNPYLAPLGRDLAGCTYSEMTGEGDVRGEVVDCAPFLTLRWQQATGALHEVETQLIGAYNLKNALAAIAIGLRFDVPAELIDHALRHYRPTNSRSEFRKTACNRLVVDAYNANLSSMHAAIENFRHISDPHKVMILGDMRELGTASEAAHEEVAQLAATAGCERVWLVGQLFATHPKAFPQACTTRFVHFDNVEAVEAELQAHPLTDCLILIKGSNGTRLFQLPDKL